MNTKPTRRRFALIMLALLSTASFADDGQTWRAHYLANSGVMIARGETKILFDPFFRNDFGVYDRVPQAMEADIVAGVSPWDGIDAIFISHYHGDHFDPAVVMRFLHRWPAVRLYAPQQAVAALLALDEPPTESIRDRLNGLALERDSPAVRLEIDGLLIEAVRIAHAGWPGRHADVENIAFRVTLDNATTVMHLGDADAGRDHYAPHESYWQARATDLAMVPVWLLLTDKGRFVLDQHVDAAHEIGIHVYKSVPDDVKDRPPKFDGLDIFTAPGEVRHFRADTGALGGVIPPTDPRFNVFELSNAAGSGTYISPVGTVILSFVSKDSRYCRAARFPAEKIMMLACREERGWKMEASSNLSPAEASYPTNFGGGYMREINDAVGAMMASTDPLDEAEVIEAAAKGWRNPEPVDENSLDARQILARTSRVYRTSKSYVDTGTVQTVYSEPSSERIGETRFKTAYVAPVDFRFESTMNDFGVITVDFIVGQDQDGVEAWFSPKPELMEEISSIQEALDAAAGISRDASGMIPGLIFPGTKLGGDIVRLTSAVRLEDAQIDGIDCFQVQGLRWPNTGRPTTVWIDKESFLIRQVYEEQEIKGVVTKTTWFYTPAINVPVDEDALRFTKPAS